MTSNCSETYKMIRFAKDPEPNNFEQCAFEHLFDSHLCPSLGINAEILKDYVLVNNYALKMMPAPEGGVNGGDHENRTTLRLLALNESDFTGFNYLYLPERLIRFDYSFPIVSKQYAAVVQNPADVDYRRIQK